MLDLHRQFAFENEKELTCPFVVMPCLAGAGRHQLFDDVQLGCADEIPSVTVIAPGVVFGTCGRDDFGGHPLRIA